MNGERMAERSTRIQKHPFSENGRATLVQIAKRSVQSFRYQFHKNSLRNGLRYILPTFRTIFLIIWLLSPLSQVRGALPEPEYLTVRNGLPQGYISSLIQDRRGFIWMATRDGLCRYDGVRFRIYAHDPQEASSLIFSSIAEIKEDKRGFLWIRTENENIDRFDPTTGQALHVSSSSAFSKALGQDQLVGIQPDPMGSVWVATRTGGFFLLNSNGTVTHRHATLPDNPDKPLINSLLIDKRHRLWLATQAGLYSYEPSSGQFTTFRAAQGLPRADVYRLHERRNGELMLGFPGQFALFDPLGGRVRKLIKLANATGLPLFGSDYRGIDYVNQNRFNDESGVVPLLADPAEESPKLARFAVVSLLVDRTNVLWLGLNGDGIIKYDLIKRPFQPIPYTANFQTDWLTQQLRIPRDAIPAPIRLQSSARIRYGFDGQRTLWISSPETPPYRYNAAAQTFTTVLPTGIESRWLTNGQFRLTALSTGAQGEIWGLLGPTNQAVVRHNPVQETFTAFPLPLPANHPYVITAMVVDGGRVYLATQNYGLLRADLSNKRLIHWKNAPDDPKSLPGNSLLCLAQDPKQYNFLWIGTFGDGLCRLDKMTGRIQRFTIGQGLSNNVIYAIRPDRNGYLWLSTNRGLCRFDARKQEVRTYMADDGLPSEEFRQFHDVTLPDGRLIFGGIGGYTAFNPLRIREDVVKPTIALTALRINNQLVRPNTPDSPLQKDINETREIVLNHQQNFLSIDFTALEFNQSYKNQYRHKLTGLEDDWVYSQNLSTATYTNLPPATYTFYVNASNTSGVWSPYTHTLRIVIEPPLWATWWAYTGYVLLVLCGLILFFRVRIHRIRLKSRMELREQESRQLKHLDEVKSRFFSNITHEFRTPLTLILTPLEEVLNESVNSPYHGRLRLIYQNANRLLRLINELLDLAKLDAGSLTVTPTPADLPEFIKRTLGVFSEEAQRKRIQLRLNQQFDQPYYWFDPDKLEKILTNLLSNALKFTDESGLIDVSIQVDPIDGNSANTDLIQLTVHNTGTSIPGDKIPHIFNRFYQADSIANTMVNGSGIGLALVKELVELLKGKISVESHRTMGTTFQVELPFRQAHPQLANESNSLTSPDSSMTSEAQQATFTENAPRLLLVEDNDGIADYLISILTPEWRIRRVNNGQAGLDAAIADGPDFIISDVLMPEMDGLMLCRQLKQNPVTSHIPILLLTAKASVESRLEGIAAGADDYVAKPFQVDELRGRIRNRLDQQQRIRHHHRTQLVREGYLPVAGENPEDEFMNRIYAVLEARLDDPTFGVEPLADAIGMSRMHLNRKVKAMTDMTPNELIRIVRLNRAAALLVTGVSVSEVADRVGFDTPAYFSKVFKDHYHVTPSEYVDKNRHELA
ncbi:hybrid sensor histidine kinase/response regulator transcription factor [Spirosoma profusum]|nr:hybrid sensor histidine kinase/response regulator transcription factor [Spirosoma profusum]